MIIITFLMCKNLIFPALCHACRAHWGKGLIFHEAKGGGGRLFGLRMEDF